jgi:putative glycosyltransferase
VPEFYRRCREAALRLTPDYEFVFVDDGSPDNAAHAVEQLAAADPRVRLVQLSRNFGQHPAMLEGLRQTTGDYVFLLDADLEDEPEWLDRFYTTLTTHPDQPDVVYGYMQDRKGAWFERVSGSLFYGLMRLIGAVELPPNVQALRLMRREYVQALDAFGERHLWLAAVMQLAGFRQLGLPVEKRSRGSSSYTSTKRMRQALDAVLSFSNQPLVLISLLGSGIMLVAFGVLIWLLVKKFLLEHDIEGYASLMASVWFLGGLITMAIGITGLYVGKVFIEVKRRPRVIVRRVVGRPLDRQSAPSV